MGLALPSIDVINENVRNAKALGIAQLSATDLTLNGRHLTTNGQRVLNFGSCSYLGLELDERLKQGAIDAISRYGTQFSSSRAYMSLGLYDELESLLEQLFGHPTIVAPTTTLGHLSNIPALVGKKDVVILDHQVHASVQNAVKLVKAVGVEVEMIRHNNMEYLESRIKKLQHKYDKIWYMADGIYSMYGDTVPMKALETLLNKYEQLHAYVDDAHGMSWKGKHGKGFVLDEVDMHERLYVVTSFAKSFATGGGALIFPNKKSKELVRNCGGTMMFSGPLQPANLGAAIASARIHLSDEINELQDELHDRMQYFLKTAKELKLPLVNEELTPIFFIGIGQTNVGYDICKRLLDTGFYTNIAAFPSVPYNRAGLRMTITRHHTFEDISRLLHTISSHLDQVLSTSDYSRADIFKAFKMEEPPSALPQGVVLSS